VREPLWKPFNRFASRILFGTQASQDAKAFC
jgi:hypothetical protein